MKPSSTTQIQSYRSLLVSLFLSLIFSPITSFSYALTLAPWVLSVGVLANTSESLSSVMWEVFNFLSIDPDQQFGDERQFARSAAMLSTIFFIASVLYRFIFGKPSIIAKWWVHFRLVLCVLGWIILGIVMAVSTDDSPIFMFGISMLFSGISIVLVLGDTLVQYARYRIENDPTIKH